MQFVNLTPHAVNIVVNGEVALTVHPEPHPARVQEIVVPKESVYSEGIAVRVNRVGYSTDVTNLPAPQAGVGIIVSQLVAQALPERSDLYFPHEVVRDATGRIIGCAALAQL